MYDHVELPVSDLVASAAFHRTVLAPLGLDDATSFDPYIELGDPDGHDVEVMAQSPETRRGWAWLDRWPVG